jgi:hypothetical protein
MIGTAVIPLPWIRTVVPIIALVTGAVACAISHREPDRVRPGAPTPRGPLGMSGTEVLDASRAGLASAPLELDRPKAKTEWVQSDHGQPERTAAAFVYSTRAWGDVVVAELLTTQTQADLVPGRSPCNGCVLPPDREDLPGGVVAFVSTDAYHTGISWNCRRGRVGRGASRAVFVSRCSRPDHPIASRRMKRSASRTSSRDRPEASRLRSREAFRVPVSPLAEDRSVDPQELQLEDPRAGPATPSRRVCGLKLLLPAERAVERDGWRGVAHRSTGSSRTGGSANRASASASSAFT